MNWKAEYEKLFNKDAGAAPGWILELAVRYQRLRLTGGLRTETEFKMANLTKTLDVTGVKRISDVWKYMVVRDHEEARAMKRKKPAEPKPEVTKSKRPTAAATVLALLRETPVRSDEAIIEAVHAATFHDGFNASQLSWYRAQFKQGRLKGQNGEPETIDESVQGLSKSVPSQMVNDGHAGKTKPKQTTAPI